MTLSVYQWMCAITWTGLETPCCTEDVRRKRTYAQSSHLSEAPDPAKSTVLEIKIIVTSREKSRDREGTH